MRERSDGPRRVRAGRPGRVAWLLGALLLPVLLSAGGFAQGGTEGAATADPEASALLVSVRQHWEGRSSFSARFEQSQLFAGFDEPVLARGTMRVLRPRYFELSFDPPNGQRQICDGVSVWTYVPEQKQAIRMPLGPDARRGADLLDWALAGATARSATDDPAFAAGAIRLDLTPGSQLPIEQLRVWVASDRKSILGYEAADGEGNRTRLSLLDVQAAPKLSPEDFRFVPPPGTEVVDLGEGE